MTTKHIKVLIAGGGIGGITALLALRQPAAPGFSTTTWRAVEIWRDG
jgi:cation diffusion facilitator CzcD-associated flavoprotein CzcO